MATLLRTISKKSLHIYANNIAKNSLFRQPCCSISTSKKKKDSLTVRPDSTTPLEETEEFKKLKEHFQDWNPDKPKNWISYGFDFYDRDTDTWLKNMFYFLMVSCTFVGVTVFAMYSPDTRFTHWAWREAFLELERRETQGLPLIDPNLLPPESIELPTEEEIGDQDIII